MELGTIVTLVLEIKIGGVLVYNTGLPADSAGDQTLVTFTATVSGYIAQISVDNSKSGAALVDSLLYISGAAIQAPSYSVSGLLNGWNTIELKISVTRQCNNGHCVNNEYINWLIGGTLVHELLHRKLHSSL